MATKGEEKNPTFKRIENNQPTEIEKDERERR